ncbi:MAG TPA: DUF6510 family protein [Anaerolineaceae bacterium]|nr:DUF6510 family protein [Anaerolineaceae bacterium]
METQPTDPVLAMMLDGNALAGTLQEIFSVEMTTADIQCAACGRRGEMGSLWAFTQAPGVVLRCPTCHNILLRIVVAPDRYYIEARGAAHFCIPR